MKAPSTRIPIFMKRRESFFLSVVAFRSQVNSKRRFWAPKPRFLKRDLRVDIFENAADCRSREDGRKRRFSNTTMTYIIQRKLCEGQYRICIVLALSCGCVFFLLKKKISVFKNIRIRWTRLKKIRMNNCVEEEEATQWQGLQVQNSKGSSKALTSL